MEEEEEEISFNLPILKAVKKTTYNGIINKARLNINPGGSPIQKSLARSQSFKKILNFVPRLKPRKSTFVPTPLKLNNVNKEKDDNDKQLSGDEIEFIDRESSSSSSLSSSEMNNTSEEEEKDKEKKIIKEIKEIKIDKAFNISNINNSSSNIEKIESNNIDDDNDSFYLNEIIENDKKAKHKNIKNMRKKMSHIKAKLDPFKFKETEGIVHDNFKNNFDIGLKNYEKEDDYNNKKHASINAFDIKSIDKKVKSKSIFDVLSNSKNSIKQ